MFKQHFDLEQWIASYSWPLITEIRIIDLIKRNQEVDHGSSHGYKLQLTTDNIEHYDQTKGVVVTIHGVGDQ